MPVSFDEQPRIDGSPYSALLGSSETSEAHQATNIQSQTNIASLGVGYGQDHLHGDDSNASACSRQASGTVLKTPGSETVSMGDCREASATLAIQVPDQCACVICLKIGIHPGWQLARYRCRFPSCHSNPYESSLNSNEHEKSHYGQPGKYTCLEQDCQTVTKNFGDLKRHCKTNHCTSPDKEQFPCPKPWCKYSGSNGFARKDKLKSHYQNVHEGKPGPVKDGRVIKPATLKPKVPTSGGSADKQKE